MKHRRVKVDDIAASGWNCKNASERRLRRYLRKRKKAGDVAVVLIEVWKVHAAIHAIAAEMGWEVLAEKPVPGGRDRHVVTEQGDTVLLVAPEFNRDDWEVVVLTLNWLVKDYSQWHEPRRLIRATGTVGTQRVELLACHGPTGGNGAAVAEFLAAVRTILERTKPDTLSIALGDFNVRVPEARKWARDFGARVAGHGPDLAVVLGGRVRSRRRGKHGSDHYAMAHRIRPGRRKKRSKP